MKILYLGPKRGEALQEYLALKKVYKNKFFIKYLPGPEILVGYTFDDLPAERTDPLYNYNLFNSDIAFFTFKNNGIKLQNELELPQMQRFYKIKK